MAIPPAEAPQLRPLGVGDIVDRVFALYRSKPLLFLAVAAVPYLLLELVIVGLGLALGADTDMNELIEDLSTVSPADLPRLASLLASLAAFGVAVAIAAIVILSVQSAALVDVTSSLHLGRGTTFGAALRTGLRAAPRVIAAGLFLFVGLIAVWILAVLVMVLSNQALVVLTLAIGALAATVYVVLSTVVMPVVATLEGVGPMTALRRSWHLSAGSRGRILGLQMLLFVLNIVIGALLSIIFVGSLAGDDTVRSVVQQIANVLVNVAWAPVQWAAVTVLYYDLRVRREAYDLQLAAEALPR